MPPADAIGFIAGALSTCSLIPQLIRVVRLRSAREISLPFASLFLAGVLLWMGYGIIFALSPVIFWNSIAAALMTGLVVAKLRFERRSR